MIPPLPGHPCLLLGPQEVGMDPGFAGLGHLDRRSGEEAVPERLQGWPRTNSPDFTISL